jgi:hypothetical protein
MSRKKGRKSPGSRYVGLPHYMLDCPAFKTLPGDALKLLIYIWKRHNGVNNGEITFAVREAGEGGIGISKSVAARMLEVLIERGFLVIVRNSGFNVKTKLARSWRLTAEPYRDKPGTKDFMRWKPSQKSAGAAKPADAPPADAPTDLTGNHSPAGGTENPATGADEDDADGTDENLKHSPCGGTHSPCGGTSATILPVLVPVEGLNGQKCFVFSPAAGTLIRLPWEGRSADDGRVRQGGVNRGGV